MEEWLKAISTLGFPIVVAAWLLIRVETTIKALTDTVTKLIVVLAKKGVDFEINGK